MLWINNIGLDSDTNGEQSDILTIEVSSSIALDGIILLSNTGGWVLSYTVETLHGSNWIVDATVVDNNESSLQYVPFAHSVHNVTQLRIVVTKVQIERYKYIRINEVYSIMARANSSNISTSRPTLECSNALKIPSIDSSHCQTDFNIVAIVGGVLGLFILILSIVVLLLLRKLKQLSAYVSQFIEHSSMEVAEASFVPAELSISNGRVSYRKSELDSRGSHQRSELDSR